MNSDLLAEVLALRNRYDDEPVHSDHVTKLALELFDALEPWHKYGARERELLECGALMHDIGWSQTPEGRGHHKKSAELIRKHKWHHLAPDEVDLVAEIARYHRKSPPKPKHKHFHKLVPSAQRKVMVLAGILRQADALDRTHIQKVMAVGAKVSEGEIVVRVTSKLPWPEEKAIFEKKRDMLEKVATRPVRCENAK
jgi:exopolyphosphatase/guanosine-5'-triphosphate,3'-diphosphate pyrophosphatase